MAAACARHSQAVDNGRPCLVVLAPGISIRTVEGMDEARRDSGVTTMTASRLIGGVRRRVLFQWRHFWVSRSGPHGFGRFAARIAGVGTGPYHGREFLSYLHPNGFVAHTAWLHHPRTKVGQHA